MKQSDIATILPDCQLPFQPSTDLEITGIQYDSRKIKPGNIFVAIPGHQNDGSQYVPQAISNGACVIVAESYQAAEAHDILHVQVSNSRYALACLAQAFFHHPSKKLCLIGITGTNGKTTTTYLIENILKSNGHATGVISTIEYRYHDKSYPNPLTTPESLDLQRILHEMQSSGITHIVMEVSSHGLELDRVIGCEYDVAVFTNLTQDHLDFHQTMDAYWQCKKRLFFPPYLSSDKHAVINCDNHSGVELQGEIESSRVRVGKASINDIYCQNPDISLASISGTINTPIGSMPLTAPLTGDHNLQNILCATGVGIALKIPLSAISSGISQTTKIPGRLERLTAYTDRYVFVDYAHTPDALENVIQCIRKSMTRRLITVFGCGGDRDRSKRPLMGKVAASLSDLCIVTSDNPRSEPPNVIIDDICQGMDPSHAYKVEPDRAKAIGLAIHASCPQDVVLIAGKGHETYQILGDRTIDFDDRECALRYLDG